MWFCAYNFSDRSYVISFLSYTYIEPSQQNVRSMNYQIIDSVNGRRQTKAQLGENGVKG